MEVSRMVIRDVAGVVVAKVKRHAFRNRFQWTIFTSSSLKLEFIEKLPAVRAKLDELFPGCRISYRFRQNRRKVRQAA